MLNGYDVQYIRVLNSSAGDVPQPHRPRSPHAKSPCLSKESQGLVAVAVGFEPTERFHVHTLSRRAP